MLGWIISGLAADAMRIARLESVIVGSFGAAIGGILVVGLWTGIDPSLLVFSWAKLALGALGALAALGVLAIFRRAIGPMQRGKSPRKHRFYD